MLWNPADWLAIDKNLSPPSKPWPRAPAIGPIWAIAYFRMIDYELSMAGHTWLENLDCRGSDLCSQHGANHFQQTTGRSLSIGVILKPWNCYAIHGLQTWQNLGSAVSVDGLKVVSECVHQTHFQTSPRGRCVGAPQPRHGKPGRFWVRQKPGMEQVGHSDFKRFSRSTVARRMFSIRVGFAKARKSDSIHTLPSADAFCASLKRVSRVVQS